MPWLLLLHIVALICWCGSLLYLPALINGSVNHPFADGPAGYMGDDGPHIPRWVFISVATPAALVSIGAGTAVFLAGGIVQFWLIAKLALVAALVAGHMLVGLLIARAEKGKHHRLSQWCCLLAVTLCLLMLSIIWIVLSKPLQEA